MSELVAEYVVAAEPATELVQAGFDYNQIDEGIRDEVRDAAQKIRAYGEALKGSMIGIGKRLIEVKNMLPEKQFGGWIEAEFNLSHRMAQNLMNVARVYGNRQGEIISPLSDTVLYLLAAPSTPEEVRAEIEQRAADGERIKVADVRAAKAVAKFTEPKPPAPPREVRRIRPDARKPETMPAQAVYVGPVGKDEEPAPFPPKEEFAAIEAAVEASITPEGAEKMRQSAERSRRLREDLDFPQEPTPPIADATTPDDLFAAGMVIEQHRSGGWYWVIHNHAGGSVGGHFHATPKGAIAEARAEIERYAGKPVANQRIVYPVRPTPDADEQAAIAAVAAEQAEEDAERAARDAARAPAERAVVEVEADSVTVPIDDIRQLLLLYSSELSHRPEARQRIERVQRWLDIVSKGATAQKC